MNVINWIVDNWYVIVGLIALIVAVSLYLCKTNEKRVLEWLLGAVTQAERELGSGTGKLKLRAVYDAFITKFPVFSKIISFDRFSKLVDDALDQMRAILESNVAVQNFVNIGEVNHAE